MRVELADCLLCLQFAKGTQDINLHLHQPGSHFIHLAKLDLSIEELRQKHGTEITTLCNEVSVLKKERDKVKQRMHPESPSFVQLPLQQYQELLKTLSVLQEVAQLEESKARQDSQFWALEE